MEREVRECKTSDKDGYFLLSFFNATIHALTTETINRFIPIIVCTIS